MRAQDMTPDRPQRLAVWIVDEAAEILAGRPSAGKTPQVAALAAQIAAKGHRIGIVTHSKAAPVVAVDDGAGLPDRAHCAPGDGAVSE